MNSLMVVLRFMHIVGGIFWGGAALVMSLFIGPGIAATGEAGQQFAQYMTNKIRIHIYMTIAAVSTILAGVILYWIDSGGFTSSWMKTTSGIGFGVGAVFGLIAFISGAIYGNGNAQLGKIGSQIKGKPTDEQLGQIQTVQKKLKTVSPIHITSMILAMVFMAISRYLIF